MYQDSLEKQEKSINFDDNADERITVQNNQNTQKEWDGRFHLVPLNEEPKCSLNTDDENQTGNEQNLSFRNESIGMCKQNNWENNRKWFNYISDGQQAAIKEQKCSQKEKCHTERGETDANLCKSD